VSLTRVVPGPIEKIELDDRARLLEIYRPPHTPWLRFNLITSVSGSAAGSDGTSETLTNAADRRLLGVIRELADIVLVGAQSVRAEGFQLPRRARLAVVTTSGDLSGHRIDSTEGRVYVVCPASVADRAAASIPGAELITIEGVGPLDPAAIVAALHERGFTSIVCEGGPSLVAQFVVASLVDELCLSTSPTLGGPSLPLLGQAEIDPVRLELSQLLLDDASGMYARWAVRPTTS